MSETPSEVLLRALLECDRLGANRVTFVSKDRERSYSFLNWLWENHKDSFVFETPYVDDISWDLGYTKVKFEYLFAVSKRSVEFKYQLRTIKVHH